MENKELKNREKVALELNIAFNEALELFSEESLNTMKMSNVVGGLMEDSDAAITQNGICINFKCAGCSQCGCINPGAACKENGLICVGTLELPSLPKPSISQPSLAIP